MVRSDPNSAFTRVFDALWDRVSNHEADQVFARSASRLAATDSFDNVRPEPAI